MPSLPSPDASDSEQENMFISLTEIKTIAQLYTTKILKPAAAPKIITAWNARQTLRWLSQGDITKLELDSIVNAANKSLLGGGGVDGAIHDAAGPELLAECRTLDGCPTGESKITKGYRLPSKHVIHTVGPVYSRSDVETRAKQLASCYKSSLALAVENSLKHIAFPSVSTGIYGYPIEDATHIALDVARRFIESEDGDKLDRIIFIVWSNKDKWTYEDLIPEYFPPEEENLEAETEDIKMESQRSEGESEIKDEAPKQP